MLVLTPVSAFTSGYYPYRIVSAVPSQNDYLEAVAQVRAEAIRRSRQQELKRRQMEEQRRQAELEIAYQQQMFRERQRHLAHARQREEAYVRALLEAQEFQRAQQLRLHRARREQQLLSAVAALGSVLDLPTDILQSDNTKAQVPREDPQSSNSQAYSAHSTISSARERLQQRLERESDPDVRSAVEGLLSVFPLAIQNQDATVDHKGKGKAREVPVHTTYAWSTTAPDSSSSTETAPAPTATPSQPASGSSLKNALQQRMQNEEDSEIRASLNNLFTKLYGSGEASTSQAPAGSSTHTPDVQEPTHETSQPSQAMKSASSEASTFEMPSHEGADLHRKPALPPAVAAKILSLYQSRRARHTSLGAIKEIEDALHTLQATFTFPTQLDFSPLSSPAADPQGAENGLMYTSNNRAVHKYENALNGLLERLDAVDSRGDLAVRGRRKEVVNEVERALRDIERKVEESRERERSREAARTPLAESRPEEAPVAQDPAFAVDAPLHVNSSSAGDNASLAAIAVEESTQARSADPTSDIQKTSQTSSESVTHSSPAPDTPNTTSAALQPPVADLSYAASTLGIPVTSDLASACVPSPSSPEDQLVPDAHTEADGVQNSREQGVSSATDTDPEVSRRDALATSEAMLSQPERIDAALEAPSPITPNPAESDAPAATPAVAPQTEPVSSNTADRDTSHPEHDNASTEASSPTASSSENDAFLLASHPLQDAPRKSSSDGAFNGAFNGHENAEVVTLADTEMDNSSEWSEIEA